MIYKDEIDSLSDKFEIHTSNLQRDYVFGWVLAGIYTISELKDILVLKGGNCFRKAYFENTRFSNDLDFGTSQALDQNFVINELNNVCDFVSDNAGVSFNKSKNRIEQKTRVDPSKSVHEARLYFKDFYGNESKVIISIRLDITQYDKIFLPVQQRYLIHPYSDYKECKIMMQCLKVEELLASKLKCLIQRRHSCDFYDYVFSLILNKDIKINKIEIATTFLKMTIYDKNPNAARGLLIDLPFHALKILWEKFIICPIQGFINFDNAVEVFRQHILELFGSFGGLHSSLAFFPANLRNPIMDAANSFTLLEVKYDGISRLVEPYSLVYKVRKDGHGQEYFYVWDQTGGRSSGPGLKIFLNTKIQSLKNTDIKFDPRFEVELKKAGELTQKTYFSKPFSSVRTTTRTTRHRTFNKVSGTKYVFECTICGKKFRRKNHSSKLNKHKDKYGNQCFGRTGLYVDTIYN